MKTSVWRFRSFHRAFTLIELLVVIAIIAVLIGLLLPAIQKVRSASERTLCSNNLKQVALALLLKNDVDGHLPPGEFHLLGQDGQSYNRACWMQVILPYLEQDALFNKVDSLLRSSPNLAPCICSIPSDYGTVGNCVGEFGTAELDSTRIPSLMCPSDPNKGKVETFQRQNGTTFHGNYVLCAGSTVFGNNFGNGANNGQNLNGIFYCDSETRLSEITDGTSNTLLASEINLVPDSSTHDLRGRYYNTYQGNVLFSTLELPNTSVGDEASYCIDTRPFAPCQSPSDTNLVQYARSYHSGGVNGAFGDGAVRFLTNAIDKTVYHALGTRGLGDIVGDY